MAISPAVQQVLARLEERSRQEATELQALNDRGAEWTRAAASRLMLDVGPDVGRFLNILVRAASARMVVEVGGSVGYSTIWLAEAVADTGGQVVSIEPDPGKVAEMRDNLAAAGLLEHVRIERESAHLVIPELPGPFDIVLIDHWKDLYIREFDLAWPKLRAGGLIVADNILRPAATAAQMRSYVAHVRGVPQARSYTLPLGHGVELTGKAFATG